MTKYKVVRTYDDGTSRTDELQSAFNVGYEFVRASEHVPEVIYGGTRRYGYIEYILKKEVEE